MNANVSKLLNEQINKEFYSAYLYLDFANYYASVGLDGFENWYRVQAQEERDHAMLFYQYLQNNGEGVTFEAIAKPEWERGDHMTPLKKALEHEKLVTASIDAIYAAAYEARKNPVQESEEKKPLSGDPERPYSRGRAYDPAHYGRKRPAGSDAEQTEE